jgi:HSP20 family molecular chaperone IbpA
MVHIIDELFSEIHGQKTLPITYEVRDDNAFLLNVNTAGIKKEDISVDTKGNKLYISIDEGSKFTTKGKYSMVLPMDIDTESTVATYNDGILSLEMSEKQSKSKISIA